MSHFGQLLAEAETLGVAKLTWTSGPEGRWECRVTGDEGQIFSAIGSTGEDALRDVLAFLRAIL